VGTNRAPFTLLLVFFLLWSATGCEEQPDDDDSAADDDDTGDDDAGDDDDAGWAAIDELIEQKMADAHIPGLAAAVVMDGEVIWSEGYGYAHIAQQREVTPDTPFMLASTSKTVTAVALMQRVEDGAVGLEDDINDHLPFVVDNPRVEGETLLVRHIATHTSGIRDNWNNMPYNYGGDSQIALGDFVEGYLVPGGQWYHETQNFNAWQPGTQYDYGNVATALAGFLVESAGGTPFDDQCDAGIFQPLGMTNTGWHLADFELNDVAMPYEWFDGSFVAYGHYGYPDYPDGQLRASAADMGRFLAAISAGGELGGERILEQATVEQMLSPQVPDVDPTQFIYWYGTTLAGRNVVGHNGGDDGVATDLYFAPDTGIGVILLMNTDWTVQVEQAAPEIEDALFDQAESLQ
jgi:CubicO group peptidase (beta-lactamase class C family)